MTNDNYFLKCSHVICIHSRLKSLQKSAIYREVTLKRPACEEKYLCKKRIDKSHKPTLFLHYFSCLVNICECYFEGRLKQRFGSAMDITAVL